MKAKKTKATKTKSLSWTPVLKGEIYCSPACGRGCTRKEWEDTKITASQLARRMGAGWKPRVHENLGWHYEVRSPKGNIRVMFSSGSYLAWIENVDMQCSERARSPRAAVDKALERVRKDAQKILDVVGLEMRNR